MMKKIFFIVVFISTVVIGANAQSVDKLTDSALKESRKIATKIIEKTHSALEGSLTKENLLGAIEACAVIAPEIARKYKEESNYYVKRTGKRVRNPENSPDSYELTILDEFERLKQKAKLTIDHEDSRITVEDDIKYSRYMKPIFVKKPCLTCHGSEKDMPKEIRVFLKRYYPRDRAAGFTLDDLIGAISVKIPVK